MKLPNRCMSQGMLPWTDKIRPICFSSYYLQIFFRYMYNEIQETASGIGSRNDGGCYDDSASNGR